jgi:hypothetical protein
MAVLESLPGIEVIVCTEDEALKEYNTGHNEEAGGIDQHKVTKYIEAETGKVFTIKLIAREPFKMTCPALSFEVYVDGKWFAGTVMAREAFSENNSWSFVVEGPESGAGGYCVVRSMKFSQLTTIMRFPSFIPPEPLELTVVKHRRTLKFRRSTSRKRSFLDREMWRYSSMEFRLKKLTMISVASSSRECVTIQQSTRRLSKENQNLME